MLLLGGVTGRDAPGYHDRNNLLSTLGWLPCDHAIAGLVNGLGVFLMPVSFAWGAYVLYLRYRSLPL